MKKYQVILFTAATAALLLSGCASKTNSAGITAEEAKAAALTHAGIDAADVSFIRAEFDIDHGRQVYEVEFYSGNTECDYTIDAATGVVLEADRDIENYNTPTVRSQADVISEDEAKSVALTHSGVDAADAYFVRTMLDLDDGRQVYEVEFYSDNREYNYTIDAATGAVLEVDQDIENYNIPAGHPQTGLISEDEAKSAALTHAGVSNADVNSIRANLEIDDGLQVYEINFFTATTEYDYTIDAQAGTILKSEIETHSHS